MPEEMVEEARELFIQEIAKMLDVERTSADEIFPELMQHIEDDQLKQGMQTHLEQTRQQAQNVERALELLGGGAEQIPCQTLRGLKADHDQAMQIVTPGPIGDVFHAGVILKNEHLEIAAYRSLISMADAMGESEIANLLRENMSQEEEMLKQVGALEPQLGRQAVAV